MQTPNPVGFPSNLWPEDIETPPAWERDSHWSYDRVAAWWSRKQNSNVERIQKQARREKLRLDVLATL